MKQKNTPGQRALAGAQSNPLATSALHAKYIWVPIKCGRASPHDQVRTQSPRDLPHELHHHNYQPRAAGSRVAEQEVNRASRGYVRPRDHHEPRPQHWRLCLQATCMRWYRPWLIADPYHHQRGGRNCCHADHRPLSVHQGRCEFLARHKCCLANLFRHVPACIRGQLFEDETENYLEASRLVARTPPSCVGYISRLSPSRSRRSLPFDKPPEG